MSGQTICDHCHSFATIAYTDGAFRCPVCGKEPKERVVMNESALIITKKKENQKKSTPSKPDTGFITFP